MAKTCCYACALSDNDFEYTRYGDDFAIHLDNHPRVTRISVEYSKIMFELHDKTFLDLYEQGGYVCWGGSPIMMIKKCCTVQNTVNEMIKLRDEITDRIKGDA